MGVGSDGLGEDLARPGRARPCAMGLSSHAHLYMVHRPATRYLSGQNASHDMGGALPKPFIPMIVVGGLHVFVLQLPLVGGWTEMMGSKFLVRPSWGCRQSEGRLLIGQEAGGATRDELRSTYHVMFLPTSPMPSKRYFLGGSFLLYKVAVHRLADECFERHR